MSTRTQVRDPWAFMRDNPKAFGFPPPRVTATISIPPSQGVRVGWLLFWGSLWRVIKRRRSISFDLEDSAG